MGWATEEDRGVVARVVLVGGPTDWSSRLAGELTIEGFALRHVQLGTFVDDVPILEPLGGDVIVVDIDAPDAAGVAFCAAMRVHSAVPIVAFGPRHEPAIVRSLEAGADAFIARDSSPREQLARIRAVLRRCPGRAAGSAVVLDRGDIVIDLRDGSATLLGRALDLMSDELEMLTMLLRRPGRVVRREELLRFACAGDGKALEPLVRRLRDKLEAIDQRRRIRVVRGVGFVFDELVEPVNSATGAVGADTVAMAGQP